MDLNNFDKKLKSSLENLEAPFDGASWSALESKLNATFSEEQPAPVEPVDLTVKKAFERMEIPYQSGHWHLLSARMDRLLLVRRLRQSKIAEVAIFLLLLINIEGFLGGIGEVIKVKPAVQPAANVPMAASEKPARVKKSRVNASASTEQTPANSLAMEVVQLISSAFGNTAENALTSPENQSVAIDDLNGSYLDSKQFYNQSGITQFNTFPKIPASKHQPMAWNPALPEINHVPTKTHRAGSGFYLGSFAAVDQHFVSTASYATQQKGFGGGLKVGRKMGKWGIETGVAYHSIAYTPEKNVQVYSGNPVDGFYGSYANQVDADVLNIPVKVTRRLAQSRKTSVHATAGIAANIATQKRFSQKSIFFPPSSQSGGNQPDPGLNPIPGKRNDGAFEGGSLAGNTYVAAELGLRVERSLGKKYTAFVEPSYRHSVGKGFGPKREKINTFSLQAGVMAAL